MKEKKKDIFVLRSVPSQWGVFLAFLFFHLKLTSPNLHNSFIFCLFLNILPRPDQSSAGRPTMYPSSQPREKKWRIATLHAETKNLVSMLPMQALLLHDCERWQWIETRTLPLWPISFVPPQLVTRVKFRATKKFSRVVEKSLLLCSPIPRLVSNSYGWLTTTVRCGSSLWNHSNN